MTGITLLLFAAALAYGISRWTRVPVIPLLLVAGVVATRVGEAPVELLQDAVVLGASFLVFVTGMELDPSRVRNQRDAALTVGGLQFMTVGAIGTGTALSLGYPLLMAIYVGLALTASSTLVVVRLLQRRGQLFEPASRLVIGVLLLQDLLIVLLVPLVTQGANGLPAILRMFLGIVVLLGIALLVLRSAPRLLLPLADEPEILLLVGLAILFAFTAVSAVLGVPMIAGALLAGFALSRFPVAGVVRPQLGSVGDFFTAIFFTSLGALLPEPGARDILSALVLTLVVLLITPPIVAAVAVRSGFSARPALEAGLLLAQTSEISLVVGLQGMIAGDVPGNVFTVIALVTATTMMLTPLLATNRATWTLLRFYPVRRAEGDPPPAAGHVLLLGSGASGMPLLETLLGAGHQILVVDDDPAVIRRLREAEIPCIRGDASDVDVLRQAAAGRARIISSTIRRPEDNRILLDYARGVPVLVRVFEESDAEWVRSMGGTPVLYSSAAADAFMRWWREYRDSGAAQSAGSETRNTLGERGGKGA